MTDLRKAAQMALMKMEYMLNNGEWYKPEEAVEALRAALAQSIEPDYSKAGFGKPQPKQEPVAYWRHTSSINQGWDEFSATKAFADDIPLYTAPPQREWQTLTDEEMFSLWVRCPAETEDRFAFARAIEQALKEKNT